MTDAGQRHAAVRLPVIRRPRRQRAGLRSPRRSQVPIREQVGGIAGLLVVPECALRLEPGLDPPPQPPRATEAVAVLVHLPIRQLVERIEVVRHVTTQRDLGDVLRSIGIAARLDVDVRLEEHQAKEGSGLSFRRATVRRAAIERAHRRVQAGPDLLINVEPEVLPVVAAQPEDHALVAGFFERRVEVRPAQALPHGRVARPELTRVDQRIPVIVVRAERVVGDLVRLDDPRTGRAETVIPLGADGPGRIFRHAIGRRGVHFPRVVVRELEASRHVVDTTLDAGRHADTAIGQRLAALREHLHHAVGRVGAVQCRRSGALDDLDALDVLAGDIGKAEPRDHAVDDDQRILAAANTGRAAQPQHGLTARLCRVRDQPHTGHLALDGLERGPTRHGLQLVRADRRHCHRQFAPIGRFCDARHHHFLEPQWIGGELEVLLLLTASECHRPGDRLVPDVARRQHDLLAVRRVCADRQRVGAVGRRDARAAERFTRGRGDLALDDRLLRGQWRRECYEGCSHTGGQQRTKLRYAHKLPLVKRELGRDGISKQDNAT